MDNTGWIVLIVWIIQGGLSSLYEYRVDCPHCMDNTGWIVLIRIHRTGEWCREPPVLQVCHNEMLLPPYVMC